MAKTRKLLKLLEADGWKPIAERVGYVRLAKPGVAARLTLPQGKFQISDAVVAEILALAGARGKI